MSQFIVQSIVARALGYGASPVAWETYVTIRVPAAEWNALRKRGGLGTLYGVDVSNFVYRLTKGAVRAYQPIVDDTRRSTGGWKTVSLRYITESLEGARAVGLETWSRPNGTGHDGHVKYGSSVVLVRSPIPVGFPELKRVV